MLAKLKNKLFHRARDDFKGSHFDKIVIIQAINWYLRYCLSYHDIKELLLERGIKVDHSTINRWILKYTPLMEKRLRNFRKSHCGLVRIDETYIKVKGQWHEVVAFNHSQDCQANDKWL